MKPNKHEIEVLEMLNGEREGIWGAWVSACLEFLSGSGLCTRGPSYKITEKGKEVLKQWQQGNEGNLSDHLTTKG